MKALDWIPFIGIVSYYSNKRYYDRRYSMYHAMYCGIYLGLTANWLFPS